MKLKNTLILFILAVVIFAFIFFFERKMPTTREAEEQSKQVLSVDSQDVDGIVITNKEDKIELHKNGVQWEIVSPVKDRADLGLVNQVLSNAQDLNVESSFAVKDNDKASLADLGLESSGIRLKLIGKGAQHEILFGKDAAVEGKTYVRVDGSNMVDVVTNELKKLIQKKPDDFRDHKLLDLEVAGATKLDIKSAAGEIEIDRNHNDWALTQPIKARADASKVTDLIARIVNARIEAFIPEKDANLGAWGLSEPQGSITLAGAEGTKPNVLQIGQPTEKDKGRVYAKLSTRDSILILPKAVAAMLDVKPNDVRSRNLVSLNLDMVDRIHIDAQNKPGITLARKQEAWTLKSSGDTPANVVMIATFATALRDQQIADFVSDVATDLGKYGLDKPQLKVTFSSYASDNTAESKAGEEPICAVDFGKVDGEVVYAKLESEPFVVSVPRAILNTAPVDPVFWQELPIYKLKPADITSMEITRNGSAIALERTSGSDWRLTKGEGALNKVNIESLLNTIASLRAVRWTSPSLSGLGFEKPPLSIAFTTADKKSGRLTLGNATSESMWNAVADGKSGAFLVSRPDYEALDADLIEAPAPAASATGSSAPAGVQ